MAGEKLGRLYEGLIYVALLRVLRSLESKPSVHWEPTIPNLMVKPDICVGEPESPIAILLITRTASRRNWEMKFWRNVGELVDIRGKLPSALIINVGLGTELKEDLMEVFGLLCDHNIFPVRSDREVLDAWITEHENSGPKDRDDLIYYIETAINSAGKPVQDVFFRLLAQLKEGLQFQSKAWQVVAHWLTSRCDIALHIAQSWTVRPSVRRGLSKLLVFGEPKLVLSQLDANNRPNHELGEAMSQFGWAIKSLGGWRIKDDELQGVLTGFPKDELDLILTETTTNELRIICADVSSVHWLNASSKFLVDEVNNLGNPDWIRVQLLLAMKDPTLNQAIAAPVPSELAGNWLFRLLMGLIKNASGLKQGFGYEQLIGDIRDLVRHGKVPEGLKPFGVEYEQLKKAGDTDSLRRRLVDWVSGLHAVTLNNWEVALLAIILTDRLAKVRSSELSIAAMTLPQFLRRTTYEDRIAPYRFFEPLRMFIEQSLRKAGIDFEYLQRFPTLVSEGSESARDPGTTPVIKVGGTLVHWKSAHGAANTGHKTKELCGRAFALRHRMNSKEGVPVRLLTIERLILVLDGDFTKKQVNHLIISGWDDVVGPYDIDKLICAGI